MNPVEQKISCVYVTAVKEVSSSKRQYQPFKVSATIDMTEKAQADDIASAKVTEKLDGTCCLIQEFQGLPWLWARHDRKPSKVGERRLAQYKKSLQKIKENEKPYTVDFSWDASKDFKEVPTHWIPARRLEVKNGVALPDSIGHTPGWVPVELNSRQHCWHLSAVDYVSGLALVLRESEEDSSDLIIESIPLSSLCGQTCELIGTNINGNPYNVGSKKCPIHILVPHGSLSLSCPHPMNYDALYNWFDSSSSEGQVEGIVWHCANGELHKLHRHHLNLNWPVPEPKLSNRKVRVQMELPSSNVDGIAKKGESQNLFSLFSSLNGHIICSLQDLHKSIEIINDATS
uniref:RNA ligase 1 n=2 Tax=Arion vulgaris TaxID=1028688 RepID=A0A0B6ZYG3_9EUPU